MKLTPFVSNNMMKTALKLKHFLKPCVLYDFIENEKTMLFEVI